MLTDDKIRPILRTIIGPMIVEEDMRCARAIAAAQHKKDCEAFIQFTSDWENTKLKNFRAKYHIPYDTVIETFADLVAVWLRQEGK